ncbi:MATE family efflux transporter [Geoglobus ahangari]
MDRRTEGVRVLTGEPEKAVVRLSIPIMISNLVFTLYNFADGVWVAGLGAESLSAIGLFMPLFFMFVSLSLGLGIGTSSAIARKIGAGDKREADNVATHSLVIAAMLSIVILSTYFRLEQILALLGASGKVLEEALTYGRIVVAGSMFIVFNNVAVGILNGEGNTKRSMYANVAGSLLNIALDPVLIYIAGLGIAGAAYASVLSMVFSSLLIVYWMFYNSKTYVRVSFREFSPSRQIVFDILRVGLPSAFSMLTMSFSLIFINAMIVRVSSADGIAVFTSAWRVVHFGFIPMFGLSGAGTAVMGAAFGARNIEKLERAYRYAIKVAVIIEAVLVVLFISLAGYLAMFFTYSEASARIYGMLVETLRILPVFLVFAPLGILTVSLFQGIGRGENAFAITVLRTIVFQLSFAYIFAFLLGLGFDGIVYGVVLGNILASSVAFLWGRSVIGKLKRECC